ncbi:hypothetical protein [Haloarchaeobius amylolyticus]|uniref:hypothetical protein n=1 Tax=Haloarchaeobius amylolyticus TaxID=1198296 RepID=UPI00226EBD53|nr:hypothetical protein [Haloarchaeobius amylolyticus]
MTIDGSKRRLFGTIGAVTLASLTGCLQTLFVEQPSGELVVANQNDRPHTVSITATNDHLVHEGKPAANRRFQQTIEPSETVRRSRFFVSGQTEVVVAVDGTQIGRHTVDIWRGEGGDDDRHEEALEVTIRPDGTTAVDVVVTHTAS